MYIYYFYYALFFCYTGIVLRVTGTKMVMMLKIRPDGDSDGGGERDDGNEFPLVCAP